MNGLVFENLHEWSCVFQSVNEWSCISDCA